VSTATDQIKERLDLAEVIGEYVQLKQVGHTFKGLCPFHQEKTPSFIVSPDKNIWHCFGCSEGGDLFTFVERVEGLDFKATLKMLAERAGVNLPKYSSASASPRSDQRQRIFEILELTARFYHELLVNQAIGAKASQYLTKRGVQDQTVEQFLIGYAPQSWDTLQRFLARKNFSPEDMIEAGVVGRGQTGKLYDRFRGRIIFPVHDVQGKVIGFGGRITPWHATGKEGKYVNSPETSTYSKRRLIYNLNRAKMPLRQKQPCIVVEGYMDVVMLVQAGLENVVASSGTAFTSDQIKLLSRFTDTLHFAFDSDAAGLKAAQSATQEALAAGLQVATIVFPAGKDPADIAEQGSEAIHKYTDKPISLVAMLLSRLQQDDDAGSRSATLQNILPLVKQVTNPVQQGVMIQEISSTLHVPESAIFNELANITALPAQAAPTDNTFDDEMGTIITARQQIIGLIIAEPSIREHALKQLKQQYLLDETTKDLYKHIEQLFQQRGDSFHKLSADELLSALPPEQLPLAEGLRQLSLDQLEHSASSPLQETDQLLHNIKKQYFDQRLQSAQQKLTEHDITNKSDAFQKFQSLLKERAAL